MNIVQIELIYIVLITQVVDRQMQLFSNLLINPFLYGRILHHAYIKNRRKFFCSASQQYFNAIGCQMI